MPATLPLSIKGPAIITYDATVHRSKGDVTLQTTRESFDVETSLHGKIATRMKSQKVEISFQPDGAAANFAKLFPYNPGTIGTSILGDPAAPKALVIASRDGKTYTFHRAGVLKSPTVRLMATDTLFGGTMSFLALGKATVEQTDAAALVTLASAAFADAGFDQAKIKTARYLATWGATYTDMIARGGFEIDLVPTIEMDEVDGYGIIDATLKSVMATAKFAPANLTEAQVHALMAFQDAGAIMPGQDFSQAGDDLVIADVGGAVLSVTLHNCGPKDLSQMFGFAHRHGDIAWVASRTWTAGTGNPLVTFTLPA